MQRRKVDNRIRVLIENGVAERQRALFVVVGDRGKDQVSLCRGMVLVLNRASGERTVRDRPEPGFTSVNPRGERWSALKCRASAWPRELVSGCRIIRVGRGLWTSSSPRQGHPEQVRQERVHGGV